MMLATHELEKRFRESMVNGWLSEALYAQELLKGQGVDLTAIGPSPSSALDCIDQFPYFVDERDYYQADKALTRMESEFRSFIEQLDAGAIGLLREARLQWQVAQGYMMGGNLAGALDAYDQMSAGGWLKGALLVERNRVAATLRLVALENSAREVRPEGARPWCSEQVGALGAIYDDVATVDTWGDETIAANRQALCGTLCTRATAGLAILAEALFKADAFDEARALLAFFAQAAAVNHSELSDLHQSAQEQEAILFKQAIAQAGVWCGQRDFAQEQAALHEALDHNRWSERARAQLQDAEERAAKQEALLKRLGELNEECITRYGSHDFNGALAVARRYVAICQDRAAAALLPSDDLAKRAANGSTLVKQCKSRRFVHYATGEFLLDKLLGS